MLVAPAFSQGRLGVGGSFFQGSPVFDAFVEVGLSDITGLRFTVGTIFSGGGFAAFTVDATFLISLRLEAFQPYFGAGAGAYVETGGGAVAGVFTINGIAGAALPISDTAGLYAQMRFFGFQSGGTFGGYVFPGVGLFVNF